MVKRLMEISAFLFIAAAVPLAFIEEAELGRLIASAAAILLGGFAIAFGVDAMKQGQMKVRGSVIRRSTHPRTFRAAAVGAMCSGVVLMVLVLLPIFA